MEDGIDEQLAIDRTSALCINERHRSIAALLAWEFGTEHCAYIDVRLLPALGTENCALCFKRRPTWLPTARFAVAF